MILKAFEFHTKMDIMLLGFLTGDEQVIYVVIGKCLATYRAGASSGQAIFNKLMLTLLNYNNLGLFSYVLVLVSILMYFVSIIATDETGQKYCSHWNESYTVVQSDWYNIQTFHSL